MDGGNTSANDSGRGPGIAFDEKNDRGIRIFIGTVMVASVVVVVAATSGKIPGWLFSVGIVFLPASVAAHMWVGAYRAARRSRDRSKRDGKIDANKLLSAALEYSDVSSNQIEQYIRAITDPAELRGRVVEEVHPLNRTLLQRVTATLEIPAANTEPLLYPIMTPVKGELQDDLHISLNGEAVATLTHREYLLLTAASMHALFTKAFVAIGETANADDIKLQYRNELSDLEVCCLQLIGLGAVLDQRGRAEVERCVASLTKLATVAGEPVKMAAVLLEKLASHYAILAILPVAEDDDAKCRSVVTYERYLVPALRLSTLRSPLRFLRDCLCVLFGSRPVDLDLDLSNAGTAQSYHLQVLGPEGQYLAFQHMPLLADLFVEKQAGSEDILQATPYRRFRRRRGQRYLHLYMRAVPAKDSSRLSLRVRFYEVPPGTLGTASIAAASAFGLIYLVAAVTGNNYPSLGTDFPALVLAFPAIAGAFAGFESRSGNLVGGGTLASRISSLVTIASSLCATGLYMAQQAGHLRMDEVESPIAFLGVADPRWQVLSLLALFNLLLVAYMWLFRTAFYYWLSHRVDDTMASGPSERG